MTSTLKVQNIQYTDGDAALTIADGGGVTINGTFTSKGINDDADANAITIDSSERVAIGNTSVAGGSIWADDLVIGNGSQYHGITLYTASANGQGAIYFSDGTSGASQYAGYIVYDHASDSLYNYTATNKYTKQDSSGAVIKPYQPAFLARPASTQSNLVTDAAVTVVLGTEIFDNNADFTSNTFTAPVAGRYQLNMHILLASLDTGHEFVTGQIKTSNRNYDFTTDPNFTGDFTDNPYTCSLSVLADMDASDTAYLTVTTWAGTAQTDVNSGTSFSGYLVA